MLRYNIFGATGFIGSRFVEMFSDVCVPVRKGLIHYPEIKSIYFISTTNNYHVLTNAHIDVDTNLVVLMKHLEEFKNRQAYDPTVFNVFNFISSWFVYGDTPDLPATENSICHPLGFYSITKKCAEDLIISYCKTFNLHYRIIRLANVFGPGDKSVSPKKNALQFLINELAANRDIKLYHDGNFIRDFIYIDDVCTAIKIICDKGNTDEIYNVGSGEPHVFGKVIEIAKNILDSKSQIGSMDPTDFHKLVQVKDMYLDTKKLKSYGFKRRFSISSGIENLCKKV